MAEKKNEVIEEVVDILVDDINDDVIVDAEESTDLADTLSAIAIGATGVFMAVQTFRQTKTDIVNVIIPETKKFVSNVKTGLAESKAKRAEIDADAEVEECFTEEDEEVIFSELEETPKKSKKKNG